MLYIRHGRQVINVVTVYTGASGPGNIIYLRAIKPLAKRLMVKLPLAVKFCSKVIWIFYLTFD